MKLQKQRRKRKTKQTLLCCLVALAFFLSALFTYGPQYHEEIPSWERIYASLGLSTESILYQYPFLVCFLSVGQGDCAVLSAEGKTVLIDTGPPGKGEQIVREIRKMDADTLEYCFITHPHEDHLGSLEEVLNLIPVTHLVLTGEGYPAGILSAAEKGKTKVSYAALGQIYEIGGGRFTVLGPAFFGTDPNNNSLVLKAEYGTVSFLFTGDAEQEEEEYLTGDLTATVLKVGHHGSATSTGGRFLAAVNPSIAVISCGKENEYGHPHPEVLNRLGKKKVKIYRTDEAGTILFATDGEKLYSNQVAWDEGPQDKVADKVA